MGVLSSDLPEDGGAMAVEGSSLTAAAVGGGLSAIDVSGVRSLFPSVLFDCSLEAHRSSFPFDFLT